MRATSAAVAPPGPKPVDVFTKSAPAAFARVQAQVNSILQSNLTDPYQIAYREMDERGFGDHPYGRPVIGWKHEIEALDRETALDFYRRYYTPNNAVLVVAGDVKAEDVKARVEKFFGDIPPGPPIAKHEAWVAKRSGVQRQVLEAAGRA